MISALKTIFAKHFGFDPEDSPPADDQPFSCELEALVEALREAYAAGLAYDGQTQNALTGDLDRLFFGHLMDSMTDKIYFKDRESRFLRVNQAMLQQFGLADPNAVLGKTDKDFFQSDMADAKLEDERKILESGVGFENKEEQSFMRDGAERWDASTKLPLIDDTGEVIGIYGVSRDITARKIAERNFMQQHRLL